MTTVLKALLVIILGSMVLLSCSKKNATPPAQDCRIITITNGPDILNVTYNADGKIGSITQENIAKTFQYSGNTAVINETSSGAFSKKYIITNNSYGLATNTRIENNITGTDWENYQFEYSGKELIKQTVTNSSGGAPLAIIITWTNGNATALTSSGSTTTIDYYNNIPAQTGDYFQITQLAQGYTVLANKNAAKSTVNSGVINAFAYVTDDKGKISEMTVDYGSPTKSTFAYQYQCN